ncbi:MAG: PQQ-binding-like beta-propeller repeat protein [Planctomycetes bacterium]|nr:PQQ-binding-like beta-propeller repeat protein [Planctomycetota bacterium]
MGLDKHCSRSRIRATAALLGCFLLLDASLAIARNEEGTTAARLLETSGCEGGLIVHVGCGNGRMTVALRTDDRYLVQGLDRDAKNVERARNHVRSKGLYGPVSIRTWDGRSLPYADDLVNLLVIEDRGELSDDEVLRVVAPGGAVCSRTGDRWSVVVKPWPDDIDQWTHHLHDASNNPVGHDRRVGPPRHLQWTAGPLWARSHGWTPSVSAMVSAGGRLFAIVDEAPAGVDATLPDRWTLVARDAFSGVLLWKRPVPNWGSQCYSGTPDWGNGVTTGRFTMPPHIGKRLVAVDETVFVTLGAFAPVTALDAATGQVRRVYDQTARADEILCYGDRLIVSLNPPRTNGERALGKSVCVVDAQTGRTLWQRGPFTAVWATRSQDPFGRLELTAGDGQVFLLTEESVVSLDLDTGRTIWQVNRPKLSDSADRRIGFAGVYEYRLTVMLYHDGVVLLAQPEPNAPHTYHTMPGTLYAFDARTGRLLWKHSYGGWGHCTPPDVFVVGDRVWVHEHAPAEFAPAPAHGVRAAHPEQVDYAVQALELRTGRRLQRISTKDIFNVGHHHRCTRNKITERFLMTCRRGVEFVDLQSGQNYLHHWVRSGCLLGYLPCNGLLYVTPHPCQCFIGAKLKGFNALAAQRKRPSSGSRSPSVDRLQRGSAYAESFNFDSPPSRVLEPSTRNPRPVSDWPTYRHDGHRSGATEAEVGTQLKVDWTARLGERLSSVVVAEGKLFVADVNGHTLYALDASSGRLMWRKTAGGRIDSPPTVYRGLVLFGSADGWVYCLRATDGVLVWRFRAAPEERQITAFGQLESVWPVHGSVLVRDDQCWLAAGRSSYLDGGIHVFVLDPKTGQLLQERTFYSPKSDTGKMPGGDAFRVPGLLNDILVTDGESVFVRQMKVSMGASGGNMHLYTTAGFLDSTWFNRTYWRFGRAESTGIMVLGEGVAYGVEAYPSRGANTLFRPGSRSYRLMALSVSESPSAPPVRRGRRRPKAKTIWQKRVGVRITAMVRANDKLFAAGSPDEVDLKDPYAAWEGRKGGVLVAFDAESGEKLFEMKLPAPPVWDGLAAVPGRLFLAMTNGSVACLSSQSDALQSIRDSSTVEEADWMRRQTVWVNSTIQ